MSRKMREDDGFDVGKVGPPFHVDRADRVNYDDGVGTGGSDSDYEGIAVVPGKEIISVTRISFNGDIANR